MEIFPCGQCFNGEIAGLWEVLPVSASLKSVNVCYAGDHIWSLLMCLGEPITTIGPADRAGHRDIEAEARLLESG